jgi:hypothetical protein
MSSPAISAHTPTPWKHAGRRGGWDGVTSADGTDICHLEFNNPANAAFIARVANSHDDLVTALADTVRILEAVRLSAGLGKTQLERLAKAKITLSNAGVP